jgi:threonine/homoserine/homoserine lactone efflux protein
MTPMMSVEQFLAFGVAAFVLIAIPGPSVVFVIGRALAYGRPVALATVLGNSVGLLAIATLVAFGLGVIVQSSIAVFTTLKLLGAAYLIYLGVQAIRHRRGLRVGETGTQVEPLARGRAVRQGFVVGVSNPKAFMIFAAVLPQFIDRGDGHVALQMWLLGLLAFVIALASDSVWALGASQLRHWFSAAPRRGEALGAAGGISMVGLGVGLAITGEPRR